MSIQRDALAAVSVELGANSSVTCERTFDNGFLLRFGVGSQDARERRCRRRPWPPRLTSSELELRRRCSLSVASRRWRRSESQLGVAERRRLRCCLALWQACLLQSLRGSVRVLVVATLLSSDDRIGDATNDTSRARDVHETEIVGRVQRFTMEWPSKARRRTNELSSPHERAPPLVLFHVLLSLSPSLSHDNLGPRRSR